jgi:hypothetical protein
MRTITLTACGALLAQLLSGVALASGNIQGPASGPTILAQYPQAAPQYPPYPQAAPQYPPYPQAAPQYPPYPQAAPQPTMQQRAAMLKAWLQASQMQMHAYEWIETTVVSKDGEQRSNSQKRCYYGPDGQLDKIVLQQSSAQGGGPPGILPLGMLIKRREEEKKQDLKKYMQKAEDLIHSYVPPNSGMIQQAINLGNMGMQMLDPGRRVRLNFSNYLKTGDSISFDIELPTNRLLAIAVNSYLGSPDDPVTLNVAVSVLQDGTMYAAQSVLNAVAKGVIVNVTNSGYQRIAP